MDFRENKIELGIAVLAAVMIAGLFRVFGGMGADPRIDGKEISYEMPRAKNDLSGDFGLDGREIDRQYVNPFGKKNKSTDTAAADAAKKAAEAAKAKQQQAARAAAEAAKKAAEAKKKAQTQVRVVDNNRQRMTSDPAANRDTQPVANDQMFRRTAGEPDAEKKKADTLSPDQWRALLLGQPSAANMAKLVAALQAGEVEAATFYMIVGELLESQNSERQAVALGGLSQVPTAQSFELVAEKMSLLPAELQTSASSFLNSYAFPNRMRALLPVLNSQNPAVALMAAGIVRQGIEAAKNGTAPTGTDPRQSRDQQQFATLSAWQMFIPTFQRWISSDDASLHDPAQQILALLGNPGTGGVASL